MNCPTGIKFDFRCANKSEYKMISPFLLISQGSGLWTAETGPVCQWCSTTGAMCCLCLHYIPAPPDATLVLMSERSVCFASPAPLTSSIDNYSAMFGRSTNNRWSPECEVGNVVLFRSGIHLMSVPVNRVIFHQLDLPQISKRLENSPRTL